jgi:hypothetical protein
MSYLNALRLHFWGQFQANPSTVNNDPGHFDNATFQPSYQKLQGPNFDPPNGWFNPEGDAAWRLLGCRVTTAWTPSGQVPASDPVLGYIVADSDGMVVAKIVDLDSEQQLVSEIWGLQVRIADAEGKTLMRGDFDPAGFMDIWDRATGAGSGGDADGGAIWQSVLRNLEWGDVAASPFLSALRQAASSGVLSIKFNADGVNLDFRSPDFMCGRIVGTIGPATSGEPRHMVIGRQFMASPVPPNTVPPPNFFFPAGGINFCVGVVDKAASCIYLDLGNALSTTSPGGPIGNVGDLTLSVYDPTATTANPAGTTIPLGTIPAAGAGGYAQDPNWYTRTSGVVAVPLTATQLQLIATSPLRISGNANIFISEWSSGAFVRADRFVYRLSPGDTVGIPVYASRWGLPFAGTTVNFVADPSQLQPSNNIDPNDVPQVATPADALKFNATASTGGDGLAMLNVTASDPGTPRWFNNRQNYGIDGQVYGIRPVFADQLLNGVGNQWNFISFLVWSGFTPSNPVTWTDVQPIFQQYANLYPVMNRFLNLADYDSVVVNAALLQLAFGLNPADPNAMPVTRDLSPAKRTAILTWLKSPVFGHPAAPPRTVRTAAAASSTAALGTVPLKGGKTAAASRRLILQTR